VGLGTSGAGPGACGPGAWDGVLEGGGLGA
jgi:hypothetical protein